MKSYFVGFTLLMVVKQRFIGGFIGINLDWFALLLIDIYNFITEYKWNNSKNDLDNNKKKIWNNVWPNVIRTRSLLIWSQTRYRCATESVVMNSYNLTGEQHLILIYSKMDFIFIVAPPIASSESQEIKKTGCWILQLFHLYYFIFSYLFSF